MEALASILHGHVPLEPILHWIDECRDVPRESRRGISIEYVHQDSSPKPDDTTPAASNDATAKHHTRIVKATLEELSEAVLLLIRDQVTPFFTPAYFSFENVNVAELVNPAKRKPRWELASMGQELQPPRPHLQPSAPEYFPSGAQQQSQPASGSAPQASATRPQSWAKRLLMTSTPVTPTGNQCTVGQPSATRTQKSQPASTNVQCSNSNPALGEAAVAMHAPHAHPRPQSGRKLLGSTQPTSAPKSTEQSSLGRQVGSSKQDQPQSPATPVSSWGWSARLAQSSQQVFGRPSSGLSPQKLKARMETATFSNAQPPREPKQTIEPQSGPKEAPSQQRPSGSKSGRNDHPSEASKVALSEGSEGSSHSPRGPVSTDAQVESNMPSIFCVRLVTPPSKTIQLSRIRTLGRLYARLAVNSCLPIEGSPLAGSLALIAKLLTISPLTVIPVVKPCAPPEGQQANDSVIPSIPWLLFSGTDVLLLATEMLKGGLTPVASSMGPEILTLFALSPGIALVNPSLHVELGAHVMLRTEWQKKLPFTFSGDLSPLLPPDPSHMISKLLAERSSKLDTGPRSLRAHVTQAILRHASERDMETTKALRRSMEVSPVPRRRRRKSRVKTVVIVPGQTDASPSDLPSQLDQPALVQCFRSLVKAVQMSGAAPFGEEASSSQMNPSEEDMSASSDETDDDDGDQDHDDDGDYTDESDVSEDAEANSMGQDYECSESGIGDHEPPTPDETQSDGSIPASESMIDMVSEAEAPSESISTPFSTPIQRARDIRSTELERITPSPLDRFLTDKTPQIGQLGFRQQSHHSQDVTKSPRLPLTPGTTRRSASRATAPSPITLGNESGLASAPLLPPAASSLGVPGGYQVHGLTTSGTSNPSASMHWKKALTGASRSPTVIKLLGANSSSPVTTTPASTSSRQSTTHFTRLRNLSVKRNLTSSRRTPNQAQVEPPGLGLTPILRLGMTNAVSKPFKQRFRLRIAAEIVRRSKHPRSPRPKWSSLGRLPLRAMQTEILLPTLGAVAPLPCINHNGQFTTHRPVRHGGSTRVDDPPAFHRLRVSHKPSRDLGKDASQLTPSRLPSLPPGTPAKRRRAYTAHYDEAQHIILRLGPKWKCRAQLDWTHSVADHCPSLDNVRSADKHGVIDPGAPTGNPHSLYNFFMNQIKVFAESADDAHKCVMVIHQGALQREETETSVIFVEAPTDSDDSACADLSYCYRTDDNITHSEEGAGPASTSKVRARLVFLRPLAVEVDRHQYIGAALHETKEDDRNELTELVRSASQQYFNFEMSRNCVSTIRLEAATLPICVPANPNDDEDVRLRESLATDALPGDAGNGPVNRHGSNVDTKSNQSLSLLDTDDVALLAARRVLRMTRSLVEHAEMFAQESRVGAEDLAQPHFFTAAKEETADPSKSSSTAYGDVVHMPWRGQSRGTSQPRLLIGSRIRGNLESAHDFTSEEAIALFRNRQYSKDFFFSILTTYQTATERLRLSLAQTQARLLNVSAVHLAESVERIWSRRQLHPYLPEHSSSSGTGLLNSISFDTLKVAVRQAVCYFLSSAFVPAMSGTVTSIGTIQPLDSNDAAQQQQFGFPCAVLDSINPRQLSKENAQWFAHFFVLELMQRCWEDGDQELVASSVPLGTATTAIPRASRADYEHENCAKDSVSCLPHQAVGRPLPEADNGGTRADSNLAIVTQTLGGFESALVAAVATRALDRAREGGVDQSKLEELFTVPQSDLRSDNSTLPQGGNSMSIRSAAISAASIRALDESLILKRLTNTKSLFGHINQHVNALSKMSISPALPAIDVHTQYSTKAQSQITSLVERALLLKPVGLGFTQLDASKYQEMLAEARQHDSLSVRNSTLDIEFPQILPRWTCTTLNHYVETYSTLPSTVLASGTLDHVRRFVFGNKRQPRALPAAYINGSTQLRPTFNHGKHAHIQLGFPAPQGFFYQFIVAARNAGFDDFISLVSAHLTSKMTELFTLPTTSIIQLNPSGAARIIELSDRTGSSESARSNQHPPTQPDPDLSPNVPLSKIAIGVEEKHELANDAPRSDMNLPHTPVAKKANHSTRSYIASPLGLAQEEEGDIHPGHTNSARRSHRSELDSHERPREVQGGLAPALDVAAQEAMRRASEVIPTLSARLLKLNLLVKFLAVALYRPARKANADLHNACPVLAWPEQLDLRILLQLARRTSQTVLMVPPICTFLQTFATLCTTETESPHPRATSGEYLIRSDPRFAALLNDLRTIYREAVTKIATLPDLDIDEPEANRPREDNSTNQSVTLASDSSARSTKLKSLQARLALVPKLPPKPRLALPTLDSDDDDATSNRQVHSSSTYPEERIALSPTSQGGPSSEISGPEREAEPLRNPEPSARGVGDASSKSAQVRAVASALAVCRAQLCSSNYAVVALSIEAAFTALGLSVASAEADVPSTPVEPEHFRVYVSSPTRCMQPPDENSILSPKGERIVTVSAVQMFADDAEFTKEVYSIVIQSMCQQAAASDNPQTAKTDCGTNLSNQSIFTSLLSHCGAGMTGHISSPSSDGPTCQFATFLPLDCLPLAVADIGRVVLSPSSNYVHRAPHNFWQLLGTTIMNGFSRHPSKTQQDLYDLIFPPTAPTTTAVPRSETQSSTYPSLKRPQVVRPVSSTPSGATIGTPLSSAQPLSRNLLHDDGALHRPTSQPLARSTVRSTSMQASPLTSQGGPQYYRDMLENGRDDIVPHQPVVRPRSMRSLSNQHPLQSPLSGSNDISNEGNGWKSPEGNESTKISTPPPEPHALQRAEPSELHVDVSNRLFKTTGSLDEAFPRRSSSGILAAQSMPRRRIVPESSLAPASPSRDPSTRTPKKVNYLPQPSNLTRSATGPAGSIEEMPDGESSMAEESLAGLSLQLASSPVPDSRALMAPQPGSQSASELSVGRVSPSTSAARALQLALSAASNAAVKPPTIQKVEGAKLTQSVVTDLKSALRNISQDVPFARNALRIAFAAWSNDPTPFPHAQVVLWHSLLHSQLCKDATAWPSAMFEMPSEEWEAFVKQAGKLHDAFSVAVSRALTFEHVTGDIVLSPTPADAPNRFPPANSTSTLGVPYTLLVSPVHVYPPSPLPSASAALAPLPRPLRPILPFKGKIPVAIVTCSTRRSERARDRSESTIFWRAITFSPPIPGRASSQLSDIFRFKSNPPQERAYELIAYTSEHSSTFRIITTEIPEPSIRSTSPVSTRDRSNNETVVIPSSARPGAPKAVDSTSPKSQAAQPVATHYTSTVSSTQEAFGDLDSGTSNSLLIELDVSSTGEFALSFARFRSPFEVGWKVTAQKSQYLPAKLLPSVLSAFEALRCPPVLLRSNMSNFRTGNTLGTGIGMAYDSLRVVLSPAALQYVSLSRAAQALHRKQLLARHPPLASLMQQLMPSLAESAVACCSASDSLVDIVGRRATASLAARLGPAHSLLRVLQAPIICPFAEVACVASSSSSASDRSSVQNLSHSPVRTYDSPSISIPYQVWVARDVLIGGFSGAAACVPLPTIYPALPSPTLRTHILAPMRTYATIVNATVMEAAVHVALLWALRSARRYLLFNSHAAYKALLPQDPVPAAWAFLPSGFTHTYAVSATPSRSSFSHVQSPTASSRSVLGKFSIQPSSAEALQSYPSLSDRLGPLTDATMKFAAEQRSRTSVELGDGLQGYFAALTAYHAFELVSRPLKDRIVAGVKLRVSLRSHNLASSVAAAAEDLERHAFWDPIPSEDPRSARSFVAQFRSNAMTSCQPHRPVPVSRESTPLVLNLRFVREAWLHAAAWLRDYSVALELYKFMAPHYGELGIPLPDSMLDTLHSGIHDVASKFGISISADEKFLGGLSIYDLCSDSNEIKSLSPKQPQQREHHHQQQQQEQQQEQHQPSTSTTASVRYLADIRAQLFPLARRLCTVASSRIPEGIRLQVLCATHQNASNFQPHPEQPLTKEDCKSGMELLEQISTLPSTFVLLRTHPAFPPLPTLRLTSSVLACLGAQVEEGMDRLCDWRRCPSDLQLLTLLDPAILHRQLEPPTCLLLATSGISVGGLSVNSAVRSLVSSLFVQALTNTFVSDSGTTVRPVHIGTLESPTIADIMDPARLLTALTNTQISLISTMVQLLNVAATLPAEPTQALIEFTAHIIFALDAQRRFVNPGTARCSLSESEKDVGLETEDDGHGARAILSLVLCLPTTLRTLSDRVEGAAISGCLSGSCSGNAENRAAPLAQSQTRLPFNFSASVNAGTDISLKALLQVFAQHLEPGGWASALTGRGALENCADARLERIRAWAKNLGASVTHGVSCCLTALSEAAVVKDVGESQDQSGLGYGVPHYPQKGEDNFSLWMTRAISSIRIVLAAYVGVSDDCIAASYSTFQHWYGTTPDDAAEPHQQEFVESLKLTLRTIKGHIVDGLDKQLTALYKDLWDGIQTVLAASPPEVVNGALSTFDLTHSLMLQDAVQLFFVSAVAALDALVLMTQCCVRVDANTAGYVSKRYSRLLADAMHVVRTSILRALLGRTLQIASYFSLLLDSRICGYVPLSDARQLLSDALEVATAHAAEVLDENPDSKEL